eukprot:GHRQ01028882.1.p1 GENE.GHRQ01028882.1~~GHRQ01028882.1.p1  ORF type:complete len:216 (-),score=35.73 GHRQ01028882.1:40-687(-)
MTCLYCPLGCCTACRSLPVHQQEVTDEQGRRRFHGAFTGGFSAGYYNTVGSKVRQQQGHGGGRATLGGRATATAAHAWPLCSHGPLYEAATQPSYTMRHQQQRSNGTNDSCSRERLLRLPCVRSCFECSPCATAEPCKVGHNSRHQAKPQSPHRQCIVIPFLQSFLQAILQTRPAAAPAGGLAAGRLQLQPRRARPAAAAARGAVHGRGRAGGDA